MTNDLSIDIDQIRSALTRVLDAVERDHGTRLYLDGDAYWSLPVGAAFDLSKSDPALTVGQLGDDVDAVPTVKMLPLSSAWSACGVTFDTIDACP